MIATLLCVFIPHVANAQDPIGVVINGDNFPDDKFRELVRQHDQNGDGILSGEELENFDGIIVGEGVSDIKGIELLPITLLVLQNNDISAVDFSKVPYVQHLEVDNEQNLKIIDLTAVHNIKYLFIRDCGLLESLIVPNRESLTDFNLLNCHEVKTPINFSNSPVIFYFNCSNTDVSGVDLNNCPLLNTVDLSRNYSMTSANFNSCFNLYSVTIENGYAEVPPVVNVDYTGCDLLHQINYIRCGMDKVDLSALTSLTDIRIDDFQNLTSILFPTNVEDITITSTPLKSLDFSGLKKLTDIQCPNNQLEEIKVAGCDALRNIDISNNNIKELDLSDWPPIELFFVIGNQMTFLDLSQYHGADKWFNIQGGSINGSRLEYQKPEVVAVKLAEDEVGIDITNSKLDVSKISLLNVNNKDIIPKEVTIDGIRYFVFYDNSATADELIESGIDYRNTYAYDTKYPDDTEYASDHDTNIFVNLNVTSVTKHQASLSLSSYDDVEGVYGGPAPTAPTVIRSEGYDGKLTYKSSNEKVVLVNDDGELSVVGAGEAIITISGSESDYRLAPDAVSYKVIISQGTSIRSISHLDDGCYYTLEGLAVKNPQNNRVYIFKGKLIIIK